MQSDKIDVRLREHYDVLQQNMLDWNTLAHTHTRMSGDSGPKICPNSMLQWQGHKVLHTPWTSATIKASIKSFLRHVNVGYNGLMSHARAHGQRIWLGS